MWSALAAELAVPSGAPMHLAADDGSRLPLTLERWRGAVTPVEAALLARAVPPVLDVGCGPGRVAAALTARGLRAVGIDIAPGAVAATSARGVIAWQRCVFQRLPDEGRWATAVLLDGNIGIGGDPARLLRRLASVLTGRGRVLVEVAAPGTGARRLRVKLGGRGGVITQDWGWQDWATVAADALPAIAVGSGFRVSETITGEARWFAVLEH